MKKKKHKKGQGRKLFDGKDPKIVLLKLEKVWSIGGSDKEAAFFADISPASLCSYLKTHPVISERKEALKQNPNLKARQTVIDGLANNPEFSLKYLERKLSKEFSPKQQVEHTGDVEKPIQIVTQGINLSKFPKDDKKN